MKSKFLPFLMIVCWGTLVSPLCAQPFELEIQITDKPVPEHLKQWNQTHSYQSLDALKLSIDSLSNKLQTMGFLEASIAPLKTVNDTLYQTEIRAGQQIESIQLIPEETMVAPLSKQLPSQPIAFSETSRLLEQLLIMANELGYPFASFKLNPIKRSGSHLTAQLETRMGKLRTLDAIRVKGYDKFPASYSKQTGRFFLKKPFKESNLREIHQLFKSLPFVTPIREPEVLFTKDSTVAYLYFQKKANNYLEGFLGFESKNTGGIRLNGNLDVRLVNNLHQGERLELLYNNDGDSQRNFSLSIEWPYLFKTPIGIAAGLDIFTRDSSFVNSKQYAKLSVPIRQDLRIWTGVELQSGSSLEASKTLPTFKTVSLKTEIHKDFTAQTDPYFNTLSFVKAFGSWGNRKIESQSQTLHQIGLKSQYWISISERLQSISRLGGHALIGENLYTHELLRLGGILSLRGFSENQLETDRYVLFNQEFRYLLSSESFVMALTDTAFMHDAVHGNQWLLGVGAGLGIQTGGGLLQLQYVIGKTPQSPFSVKDAKVHLRFSSVF